MKDSAPIRKTPNALAKQLEGSVVILNPESGEYYSLDDVGARIWELLDGTRTTDDIVEVICAEYEAGETKVRADVESLLADLRAEKLIDVGPAE